jgi:hypothetical protein
LPQGVPIEPNPVPEGQEPTSFTVNYRLDVIERFECGEVDVDERAA